MHTCASKFHVCHAGQGLEYWGGGGGHVPTRLLINQCQIITFLILKSDNIENSRLELIERNSFASTFKSN